jgi:hypothetical protein
MERWLIVTAGALVIGAGIAVVFPVRIFVFGIVVTGA